MPVAPESAQSTPDPAPSKPVGEALALSPDFGRLFSEFGVILYDGTLRPRRLQLRGEVAPLLGWTAREMAAWDDATWEAHVHPEDVPAWRDFVGGLEAGGLHVEARYRLRHADGHYVAMLDRAVPRVPETPDETTNGSVTIAGMLSGSAAATPSAEDLTRVLERLAGASGREFLAELVRSIGETYGAVRVQVFELRESDATRAFPLVAWDRGEFVSRDPVSLAGSSMERALTRGSAVVWHDAGHEFPAMADRYARYGIDAVVTFTLRPDGGPARGFLNVLFPKAPAATAAIERLLALLAERVTDELERERTAAILQEREAHFRAVLETVNLAALGLDTEGRVNFANENLATLMGRTREELLELDWFETCLPDSTRESTRARYRALLSGEKPASHYENEVLLGDGSRRLVRWSTTVSRDAGGGINGIVSLGDDITELRRAEDEIRRLASELELRVQQRTTALAAANAELEAFSYSVSHDLRSPLRALDGFSRALEEDYGNLLDETALGYLGRIRSASKRMGMLIDDLLRLSRASRVEMHQVQVDLSSIAREIDAEHRRRNPEREVEFICSPGLSALADHALARIILENLIDNAWKYTRRKPTARICFEAMPESDETGATVFRVRDDGAGFDMRYVNKLFGPFQRLHSAAEFEGTGIGLATVRRICRRHGGRAWAEAALGTGASIYFTLPSSLSTES